MNFKFSGQREQLSNSENGFYVVFFSFCLVLLGALTALVVDIGHARLQQRRLQMGTDAAALASALEFFVSNESTTNLKRETWKFASLNKLNPDSEIDRMELGCWDGTNFTNPSYFILNSGDGIVSSGLKPSCSGNTQTAVYVQSSNVLPTSFARVIRVFSLETTAAAVATVPKAPNNCVKPFGFEQNLFNNPGNGRPLVQIGDEFSVTRADSGNWCKVNLQGINMSSGKNFENAMLSATCLEASLGEVRPGTGFGGTISKVFQEIPVSQRSGIFVPLVDDFPNGKSENVTIEEFIKVDFIGVSESGSNWVGTFRLLERNAQPSAIQNSPSNPRLVK
ncbi:MAG: hypothetical protein GYA55_01900 [SAR324 cluster bacterium]|uniref:Putative Flp pilus-assembly TadG-like N-terminal domain-containing protein n=1 Tax=SAR324 cluster bacterium TaxID=2024889 RepID=A0A7X9IJ92_9DELT|nr:hypothetical protein [SAR324 cluster bacterium]